MNGINGIFANNNNTMNSTIRREMRRPRTRTTSIKQASAPRTFGGSRPFFLLLLLLWLAVPPTVEATLGCQTTQECEVAFLPNSECVNNQCTNPYHVGGCLQQRIEGWQKTRVCHSEDPPEALEQGHCRAPDSDLQYPEIRILTQNWESAFFQAWIIQIVLSEILGIPVTLESGKAEAKVDFYHAESALSYDGLSYDYEALKRGNELLDCREMPSNNTQNYYHSCAHVLPELWDGQEAQWEPLLEQGVIARPGLVGTLAYQGLYVPLFTASNDTSLLSHLGLAGEENRPKLARTFGRPTTWKEYCEQVSENHCNTSDSVAQRAPQNEAEEQRMFVQGLYQGYFRFTEKNDCDKYPHNCTGHVVDYPCGWTSFVRQQTHHLNIALESNGPANVSGGYSYAQMTEIWAAANATKSNVMMRWWTPQPLFQTYLGGEAEFTRVDLPPPTQECVEARIQIDDRCRADVDQSLLLGDPEGRCDDAPFSLQRIFAQSLVDHSLDPDLPEEVRSPGYQTIDNIKLDGLQIGEIFDYWLERNTDPDNFDPRDASCRWVAENFAMVQSMLPPTYPRVVLDQDMEYEILAVISIIFSCIAACFVILSFIGVVWNREKPAIILAQVNFLYLLLIGLGLVSTASILINVEPSNASCMATAWLVSLGYTFELVPLLFKVAAIASLISAAKKFKRVKLDKKKLFTAVFLVGAVVVTFLIFWTVLDPARKMAELFLTDDTAKGGDTIVRKSYYCSSDSDTWVLVTFGWQTLLLLCGTILAFATRNMRKDMTESLVVSVLVYSHFMFVVLRLLLFQFTSRFHVWNLARYMSLILSGDVIAACCIYFLPKILLKEDKATRNPVIPQVFLPPASIRHIFAQVSRGVELSNIGIVHVEGAHDDEFSEDQDDAVTNSQPTVGLLPVYEEESATNGTLGNGRTQSTPAIAGGRNPRNIFRDSLHASHVARNNLSLKYDTLMTANGRQRHVDILNDSFEFEMLRPNEAGIASERSTRSLSDIPEAISARTLDSSCCASNGGEEDPVNNVSRLSERALIEGLVTGRAEDVVEDCDRSETNCEC